MPAQNKNFLKFIEEVESFESRNTSTGINVWITRKNDKPFFNDIQEFEISYEKWSNINHIHRFIKGLKDEIKEVKRLKIKITKGWSFDEPDESDSDDDDNLSVISTRTEDPCEI